MIFVMIGSSYTLQEVVNNKQRLVNNNFTMKILDEVFNDFMIIKTSQHEDKNSFNDKNNRFFF